MPSVAGDQTAYTAALDAQRRFFESGATKGLDFRKAQLRSLRRLLEDNADDLTAAVHKVSGSSSRGRRRAWTSARPSSAASAASSRTTPTTSPPPSTRSLVLRVGGDEGPGLPQGPAPQPPPPPRGQRRRPHRRRPQGLWFFESGATKGLDFRKAQLRSLRRLLEDNADDLTAAVHKVSGSSSRGRRRAWTSARPSSAASAASSRTTPTTSPPPSTRSLVLRVGGDEGPGLPQGPAPQPPPPPRGQRRRPHRRRPQGLWFFESGATKGLDFRKAQLRSLRRLLEDNADDLTAAVHKDIRRPPAEGYLLEMMQCLNEIDLFLSQLDEWAKPQPVRRTLLQATDKAAYIAKEPLGLVLIISPWNYPVNLCFMPLVGALGAGNVVVLKPSEVAAHTSALVARLVPKYFEERVVRVVEGGVAETTELLCERFDHILFTGASHVGKAVMSAAARHLTPVTLELGGKCPVVVDRGLSAARLAVAAKRVAWGKFLSCGQTCVAADYVLCFEEDLPGLLDGFRLAIKEFYGDDPQKSKDYARIISQRHFERLQPLLEGGGGAVALGGRSDRDDLYIEPTVLTGVRVGDAVMREELFGPILPVLCVQNVEEAVDIVQRLSTGGHKPLAVYVFSDSHQTVEYVLGATSSGGCTVNDVILHMAVDTLPFGGVGYSGMGRYHGRFSFDTFSHEKAVLHRRLAGESLLWFRYAPYAADARPSRPDSKLWWGKRLLARRPLPDAAGLLRLLGALLVGAVLGYAAAMTQK